MRAVSSATCTSGEPVSPLRAGTRRPLAPFCVLSMAISSRSRKFVAGDLNANAAQTPQAFRSCRAAWSPSAETAAIRRRALARASPRNARPGRRGAQPPGAAAACRCGLAVADAPRPRRRRGPAHGRSGEQRSGGSSAPAARSGSGLAAASSVTASSSAKCPRACAAGREMRAAPSAGRCPRRACGRRCPCCSRRAARRVAGRARSARAHGS